MLDAKDKSFVKEVCKNEFVIDVDSWKLVSWVGLTTIVKPGQDKKEGIHRVAFLRNASEAEQYRLDGDRVYTRLGFQDPGEEYNADVGKGRHWRSISYRELLKFIEYSIENEEVFSSIIVNSKRYNFAMFVREKGTVVLKYEWSNNEL